MSALPNPLSRKTAGLNQYGRNPQSVSERLRASSDYDQETGYAPLYHAFLADLPRLSSGNSCTLLILALWSKSAGRGAPRKGAHRPDWTLKVSISELAEICRCDVRTVERELNDLAKRGIAEVRREGAKIDGENGRQWTLTRGQIAARLCFREWEALPDYDSELKKKIVPISEDPVRELTQEQERQPGNQRVTGKQPVRLAAGALSKVYPVSCGVKSFRYRVENGPIDLEFSCVIQAGELLVTSRVPDDWQAKLDFRKGVTSEINGLQERSRHGNQLVSPDVLPNIGRKSVPVDHPRAAELVSLFDPFLGKSAAKLLVMDSGSLVAACAAVGDCDHDYLVKFAVMRAASPITKPSHVKIICREALESWRASLKPAPGTKDALSMDEIRELAAKERAMRLGRKK